MLRHLIILCITCFSINVMSQIQNTDNITTYYFIRHAEKDRSNPSEKNPHLTAVGHQRAADWNDILQHITFDAVYATDYHRTKETAQPVAEKNNLQLTIYNTKAYYNEAFKLATQGKTVLVVGHSNTTPEFVNAVIGRNKYGPIDDANNGNLYIVTISDAFTNATLLTIN